jgi:hypothetical protein
MDYRNNLYLNKRDVSGSSQFPPGRARWMEAGKIRDAAERLRTVIAPGREIWNVFEG